MFEFELGEEVINTETKESGEVVGRAEFVNFRGEYNVNLSDGKTAVWWVDADIEAV